LLRSRRNHPGSISAIKTTNEERILQNIDMFSFEIDHGDISAIEDMDRGGGIAWASGDPLLVP